MNQRERELLRALVDDRNITILFNSQGAMGTTTTLRRVVRVDLSDPDPTKQQAWTSQGTNINLDNVSMWMFRRLVKIDISEEGNARLGESQYPDW